MQTIILVLTILTVIATLLPLSDEKHWFFRGMDFPRLQIMFISIVLLIASIVFLDFDKPISLILVGANTFCILWQLWWILPYTRLFPNEVKSAKNHNLERQLSIITSNVLTPNRNSQALIDLVHKHQPDILVTLESDKWWEEQLDVLEAVMTYTVKCPLDNLYGMHLYSKLPLSESEISFLVEDDVPSIHTCIELRTGVKVRAHFVHPAPPSPTENEESTERDAELIMVARSVKKSIQPIIVTGDLNDVAWSSTTRLFRKISGLLDPRIGRGMFNTYNAENPLLRWPLDHIFHSEHFTLSTIKRLPSIGSDHFPLFTSLVFTPSESKSHEGLEAEEEDFSEAQTIMAKMSVTNYDVPEPNE